MSDSHSYEGFPQSDEDEISSDEKDSSIDEIKTKGKKKNGAADLDLKAAALAYYSGTN